MSIPSCVRECFEAFRIDCDEDFHLQDELGRFKVWVGNIAAHRPAHSRRSLEYRLRDSSRLREMVLSLLGDLKTALDDLEDLVLPSITGDSLANQSTTTAVHQQAEAEQTYVYLDHENEDMFELSDEESADEVTPVSEAIAEIHDVITCLLRFSMTLRSPGRGDQRRNDPEGVAEAFVAHDTEHVRAKFPEAPDYLIKRLGKALSRHRQYFRYRREHQAKLYEGLDDGDTAAWEMPSTIATSLPGVSLSANASSRLPTESETESNYTVTSYQGTMTGDAILRFPPWPVDAQNGSPFECPICFGIVVAETEISWNRHVFEDLPPYVCTSKTCDAAVKSFSRRRDWKLHNDTVHDRVWVCLYGCAGSIRSPDSFRRHIEVEHPHSFTGDAIQSLTAACGRTTETDSTRNCPLCMELCFSTTRWTKHVGHHLEQLALFCLPSELFTDDASDDSDGHSNYDGQQHSAHALSDEEVELQAQATKQTEDGEDLPLHSRIAIDSDSMAASSTVAASRPDREDHSEISPNLVTNTSIEAGADESSPAMAKPSLRELFMEKELKSLRSQIETLETERVARADGIHVERMGLGDRRLADLENKLQELQESMAAKNRPIPDMEQAPIKFKDAVGRKFSFPWHLCKTWKGMESLIKQAFLHVDIIGSHVQEGHYDLMGPDGEIILPQVWDNMIKPDWEVSMHMWPLPETPKNKAGVHIDQSWQPTSDDSRGFGILTPMKMRPPTGPKKQEGVATNTKLRDKPEIKPKKKELSGFAAWMAGQEPKSTKR
jgi:hypothetical protein